jgi:hypothetical protein
MATANKASQVRSGRSASRPATASTTQIADDKPSQAAWRGRAATKRVIAEIGRRLFRASMSLANSGFAVARTPAAHWLLLQEGPPRDLQGALLKGDHCLRLPYREGDEMELVNHQSGIALR